MNRIYQFLFLMVGMFLAPSAAISDSRYCKDWTSAQLVYSDDEMGEDGFYRFVRTFACRYERGEFMQEDFSRVDFPLPFIRRHTEGSNSGVMPKKDFMNSFVGTTDPAICIIDDKAKFTRSMPHSGEGYTWYFRMDKGKWRLYKVDIDNY